jgi:phytoene dehydrogenase-like protein
VRSYDVAVVDPSPGALIAASLLAKAGLSVLVLNPETTPTKVGPYRFVRHCPPVVGFGGGPLLTRCLKGLKFHPHEFQAVRKLEPGLQVISRRHRIDISCDAEKMQAEFVREYPRDASALGEVISRSLASAESFADALDQAVEGAGQVGLLQSLGLQRPSWNPPLPPEDVPTWGEFLHQCNLSDEGRVFMAALLRPFCALDVVEDLPLPVAGMHLAAVLDGVYMDPSEEHALLTLLLRRVRAMRVDVSSAALQALVGGRRTIDAIQLADQSEAIPVSFVITGGDPEDLLEFLPGKSRAYQRVLSRLAPSHFRYSIYLGVESEVVPADLAEHAVLIDDDDPEGPGGCLLMTVTPEGSPLAPEGHRAITISTLLPYAEDGGLPDDLDATAGDMVERVKWLMPYLERHLEVLQVPSLDGEGDDDNAIAIDSSPVAYTPAIPPADDPVAAGLGVSLPHRNLFCAGPAAYPALGLGGQSIAGRLVERLSLAAMKRAAD